MEHLPWVLLVSRDVVVNKPLSWSPRASSCRRTQLVMARCARALLAVGIQGWESRGQKGMRSAAV